MTSNDRVDACDAACHLHASRTASAVVASHDFLVLYDSPLTTPTGRARLLDGSSTPGPFSFWRRVPLASPPQGARATLFSFVEEPAAFPAALAIDLLLLPPVDGDGDVTVCTACAPHVPAAQRPIAPLDRHFSYCQHGIRLSGTCHDPAVHALVVGLDALMGPAHVFAERPSGRASLDDFMDGPGAGLRHRPDAVIAGLDGPGTYCLIDVKTFDPCGATHVSTDHTDRRRLAAHIAITRHSSRAEYGDLPPRMRLVVVAVSAFGSFGPSALDFFATLGRRSGESVPVPLLDSATWAAPRLAPFLRMAVGHAVRRGLAEAVLRRWRRVSDPADVLVAAAPASRRRLLGPGDFPPLAPAAVAAAAPLAVVPVAAHAGVAAALFGGPPLP